MPQHTQTEAPRPHGLKVTHASCLNLSASKGLCNRQQCILQTQTMLSDTVKCVSYHADGLCTHFGLQSNHLSSLYRQSKRKSLRECLKNKPVECTLQICGKQDMRNFRGGVSLLVTAQRSCQSSAAGTGTVACWLRRGQSHSAFPTPALGPSACLWGKQPADCGKRRILLAPAQEDEPCSADVLYMFMRMPLEHLIHKAVSQIGVSCHNQGLPELPASGGV